jgi:acetylornithine deacetylase/succinyl-diaminopimelate desuccinylase-like protein
VSPGRGGAAGFALALVLASSLPAEAQAPGPALAGRIREYVRHEQPRIVAELVELLQLPNVASDSTSIRANAALLVRMLERRGVAARLLESPAGGPPAVFGELRAPGATGTLVLYAHYDGQPVRTAEWATPPWEPTLRAAPGRLTDPVIPLPGARDTVSSDARLYARSASDDKAPIVAMLAGLDALRAAGMQPTVNLKFFFEGEEEAGSPHLEPLLRAHAHLLRADTWLFGDGPVHVSGRPQVVLGVRGALDLELTLFGPARALHSGHYGNWAPNPIVELAHLVVALRDREGRVGVPGFYEGVATPSAAERAAVRAAPASDDSVRRSLGLDRTEGRGALVGERVLLPALNLRGIAGGALGVNAIPTEATASIDFRLVPPQRPDRIKAAVEAFVRGRGYTVLHGGTPPDTARTRAARLIWGEGYAGVRTPPDAPAARRVAAILRDASGVAPVVVPSAGGSLPLDIFRRALGAVPIIVPIVNADNSQHAANENLRLGNLFDGIVVYALLMATWSAS